MASLPLERLRSRLDDIVLAAARAGYAARGFVYLSVGALAVLAAVDLRQAAAGNLSALEPVARVPLGEWWLILIGAGLGAFAAWRAMQALLDADREGRSAKGLMKRAGQGLSGVIYAALSASVFEFADELEDVGEADEEQQADARAAFVLDLPFGEWLLLATGVFVIGAGVANIAHAIDRSFNSDLGCSKALARIAGPVGRAGYFARGVAFSVLGLTMVQAGLHARSAEAAGLGGAVQSLESRPGGDLLMIVVATGLFLFGVFGLLEARYRRLRAPELIEEAAR